MTKQQQGGLFARIVAAVESWHRHARDRSVLAALGRHELRDLGLGADAVRIRSSNPVWRG